MTYLSRLSPIYLLPLFVLLATIAYFPALHGDFIYDDTIRIAEPVQQGDKLVFTPNRFFTEGFSSVLENTMPDRPLLMATIWVNYALGGSDTFQYKFTNVVLHALAALMIFIFLNRIFLFMGKTSAGTGALALGFSLLFLAHPLHNQAVTMVIQRGVLLSTLFCLIAFSAGLEYLARPRREALLLMLFAYGAALLSKPNTVTFPFIFLLLAYGFGKRTELRKTILPLLFVSFIPGFFYIVMKENFHSESGSAMNWIGYGRVQAHVIVHYLRQLVWPFGFNSTYPIPTEIGLFEKGTWLFLIAHAAAIGGSAFWFFTRRSACAFGVLAFYVALVPESSVFPIPHVVFDHRMYFPSLFLGVSFVALLSPLARSHATTIALITVVFGLGWLNMRRSQETNTYEKWVTSSALKYKNDHLANVHLLNMLFATGKVQEGAEYSRDFTALYPEINEYKLFTHLFAETAGSETVLLATLTSPAHEGITTTTRVTLIDFLVKKYLRETFYRPLDDLLSSEKIFLLLHSQKDRFFEPRYIRFVELYTMNTAAIHERYRRLYDAGFLEHYQRLLWAQVWRAVNADPSLASWARSKNLYPPLFVLRTFNQP